MMMPLFVMNTGVKFIFTKVIMGSYDSATVPFLVFTR